MSSITLRKFVFTVLLLVIWSAGASIASRPAACHDSAALVLDNLSCCRIAPLQQVRESGDCCLLPRVHAGDSPCHSLPLGPTSHLTSHQRPDSQLPENPNPPSVSPASVRLQLASLGGSGFVPHASPPLHPSLPLLATVVLLN